MKKYYSQEYAETLSYDEVREYLKEVEELEKADELKEYNEMLDYFILRKHNEKDILEKRAEELERNLEDDLAKRKQALIEAEESRGAEGRA